MSKWEFHVVPLRFKGYTADEMKIYKVLSGEHMGYSSTLEKILNDHFPADWELVTITGEDNSDHPTIELIFRRSA